MTTRTFLDGAVTLIERDCLAWMREYTGVVDHVISDPPYEKIMHDAKAKAGERKIRIDGDTELKPLDFAPIDSIRAAVCSEASRICLGWFLAFCTPEGIAPWRDEIEAAGMRYKRACFWYKTDAAPQLNGQGPAFAVEPLVAAWAGTGVSRWNGGGSHNHWAYPTNGTDRDGRHPAEKNLALMTRLVSLFTQPGDTILDPFMGSGTTALACLRNGRKFIGIERDSNWFAVAVERVEDAARRPDLFKVAAPAMKQQRLEL